MNKYRKYFTLTAILALGIGTLVFGLVGVDTVDILADVKTYIAIGFGLVALGVGWIMSSVNLDVQTSQVVDLSEKLKMEQLQSQVHELRNNNWKLEEQNKQLMGPDKKTKFGGMTDG